MLMARDPTVERILARHAGAHHAARAGENLQQPRLQVAALERLEGLHEVVRDGQAGAVGLFPDLEHPSIGSYRTVASPLRFHTADVGPRAPAPALGADTRAVLSAAGYDADEIDGLIADGAVAEGP